jgi:hypothetical protein
VRRHEREIDVARLLDRLAVVDRLQHGQLPRPFLDRAGDAIEVLGPLAARQASPRPLRPPRRGHGGVDVLRSGGGDLGEDLLGGRVDGLEGAAVTGLDELAADEQAVGRRDGDDVARLGRGGVVPRGGDEVGDGGHQSNVT